VFVRLLELRLIPKGGSDEIRANLRRIYLGIDPPEVKHSVSAISELFIE
jgi:hypothetical protein